MRWETLLVEYNSNYEEEILQDGWEPIGIVNVEGSGVNYEYDINGRQITIPTTTTVVKILFRRIVNDSKIS